MIVLSNTTAQTLAAGQSITFDTVVLHTGRAECYRTGGSAVTLRCQGIYEISYGANVTNTAAGSVQLSIQVSGATLPETTRISTPSTVGNVNAISATTAVSNCCGGIDRVTITNTGTASIVISPRASLYIRRIA